jgi:hypothetical protein
MSIPSLRSSNCENRSPVGRLTDGPGNMSLYISEIWPKNGGETHYLALSQLPVG